MRYDFYEKTIIFGYSTLIAGILSAVFWVNSHREPMGLDSELQSSGADKQTIIDCRCE